MTIRSRAVICTIILLALQGCSAHNPFNPGSTTESIPVTASKYPPTTDKVFVTEATLPADVKYEPISQIEVGKNWYGSSDKVLISMGDRARELGANAVIGVKTWHQPSGFSWSAPHGSGQAVRIDPATLKRLGLTGDWY